MGTGVGAAGDAAEGAVPEPVLQSARGIRSIIAVGSYACHADVTTLIAMQPVMLSTACSRMHTAVDDWLMLCKLSA